MTKGKSQAAELRVALELDGKHALIAQANVNRKGDLYCGPPPRPVRGKKQEIFRSSYHASGETRLHRGGLRKLVGHVGMKPHEVKGAVLLAQGGPVGMLDWTYKVRADNSRRKTLVLADRQIMGGPSISYWAIETGIADPVKAALDSGHLPRMRVVGQVVSDWTVPQVMILVMDVPEPSMAGR